MSKKGIGDSAKRLPTSQDDTSRLVTAREVLPDDPGVRWLPGVLGLILIVIYFFYPNDVPDCRYGQEHDMFSYMSLSRNLFDGEYPTKHWMPGFPVILAGLIKCFGLNWFALKSSMIVLALLGIVLSRWFFRSFFSRSVSTLLAITLASTPIVFDYSHRLMSEIPAMVASMVALLAMLKVTEAGDLRSRWIWAVTLGAGGAIAILIRGNALAIVPALLVGILRMRKPSEWPTRVIYGCAVLATIGCFAAWSARSGRHQYTGIHNVTYMQEIQAKDIGALWASSGKFGNGVERVDKFALARRVYQNFVWYQLYRIAALLIPSSDALAEIKLSRLGLILTPFFLIPFLVGFPRLAKRTPELTTFLLFSMLLIIVYPTGGSPRMLLPTIPLLLMTGYLGLEQILGTRRASGWLMCLIAANVVTCAVAADKQKYQPYSRAGFEGFLQVINQDLPKARHAGEIIGTDFPEEVFALTGLRAQVSDRLQSSVIRGEATSALIAQLGPFIPDSDLTSTVLADRGQAKLYRITKMGITGDQKPNR